MDILVQLDITYHSGNIALDDLFDTIYFLSLQSIFFVLFHCCCYSNNVAGNEACSYSQESSKWDLVISVTTM